MQGAECNKYLVTNVVKITRACLCNELKAAGSQTRGKTVNETYGVLVFYIIADMKQRTCLFQILHLFD